MAATFLQVMHSWQVLDLHAQNSLFCRTATRKIYRIKFIHQVCCGGWAPNIVQCSRMVRITECWSWRVVAAIFEEDQRGNTHRTRMRRENKRRKELREKKENEKQTAQDREISKTQWCIAGTKAEMEVKEGVLQRDTEHQPQSHWVGISQP